MSDLVKRLRDAHPHSPQYFHGSMILAEAADRIAQLEAALRKAKQLVYRPFPKPFSLESYTPFYVEWCADRERIFGPQSETDAKHPRIVEDGFGSSWAQCPDERCDLHVVRPGKVQCAGYCEGFQAETKGDQG